MNDGAILTREQSTAISGIRSLIQNAVSEGKTEEAGKQHQHAVLHAVAGAGKTTV